MAFFNLYFSCLKRSLFVGAAVIPMVQLYTITAVPNYNYLALLLLGKIPLNQ